MNIGNKRKDTVGGDNKPKRAKKECDYGERCYRRNPAHFREFTHKHLEAILDKYSGSGDYPIPDKYVLERLAIMEQLDVIVEKELYTPWKDKDTTQATTSNHAQSSHNVTNNLSQDTRNAGMSSSNSEMSSTKMSSNNSEVNSKDTKMSSNHSEVSSSNSEKSSKDTKMNSSNPEVRSTYTKMSSNSEMSSKDTKMSSKDMSSRTASSSGASSKNVGSIRDAMDFNRNACSSSSNNSVAEGNNNTSTDNLDYKKAPDYRPLAPPKRRAEAYLKVVRPSGLMAAKHAASAPYHVFYTTITAARETHDQTNSITFLEILDPSLGELKCSLQINFMVELGWLLAQYYFAGYSEKKLTILYGEDMPELRSISQKKPHVDAHRVVMKTPFGTHHSKVMLLCYEDGSMRVVISTANLYLDDWENRTQGLWFSPRCPPLPPASPPLAGESPTLFKRCLIRYLHHYNIPALAEYIERVRRCDFSHINVFLVASVPGSHCDVEWGMVRVGSLLRQHCALPKEERWPLIAQASSLGSYGTKPQLWLTGDFLHNFTKIKDQPQVLTAPNEFKLIYPSLENVRQSHDGLLGGGCLPYGAAVQTKQMWLNDYLYQWRAISSGRDRAMPHIKSYTRVSKDGKLSAFYLLTSANVSKAAWGSINKGDGNLRIMSYEAGVLLLPKFVINKDLFPLTGENRLPLAYDVPPTKYAQGMSPWVMDYLH